MMLPRTFFAFLLFALSCFRWLEYAESKLPKLPQEEVDALKEITSTMGATYWEFDSDSCHSKMLRLTPEPPKGSQSSIDCDCTSENNTCHVVGITFKRLNLPGMLPPYLAKLPNLTQVDFALNYLSGTIPKEWGSTKLTNMILSSNKLSGKLPVTFAKLQNLTDFRISDNSFNGEIPSFIQNWKSLERLVLRNCHITGELPSYFWSMKNLNMLDVSFNKLVGEIPVIDVPVGHLRFLFLTGNMLSGNLPESLLKDGSMTFLTTILRGKDQINLLKFKLKLVPELLRDQIIHTVFMLIVVERM
ncbi:putative LRR receptor-like serine/threonine-protein kinase RFK1 [Glycine max]|nr:putative LRR receptor-like serine/threonine-protein kinase RFK1 [Glycine max]